MSTATLPATPARSAAVKPVPEGMRTATPHLTITGAAEAIDWYVKAFGAIETCRLPSPDGRLMHAAVSIGDSLIMLVDAFPEWGGKCPKAVGGSPVTLHLSVEDVDAFMKRAGDAGAKITAPPEDMFWGDRYGRLEDPFGHQWSVATHIRDLTPEEIQKAAESSEGCGC